MNKFYHIMEGSITDASSGHIIHGCNAKGKMNSGVAKVIRQRYPVVYDVYMKKFEEVGLCEGDAIPIMINPNLIIWNLITQSDYGRDKDVQYVSYTHLENSLKNMNKIIDNYIGLFYNVTNKIHFPMIGCGLGHGEWNVVETILENNVANKFEKSFLWRI